MKLSKNRKAVFFLLAAVFVCILCSGCQKEEPKSEPETTKISETAATDTENTSENVDTDKPSPTVPATKKNTKNYSVKLTK